MNHWPQKDKFVFVCNYDHPGVNNIKSGLIRDVEFILHRCWKKSQFERVYNNWDPIRKSLMKLIMFFGQYVLFLFYIFYFYFVIKRISPDRIIICNGGYPAGDTCRAAVISSLLLGLKSKPLFVYHGNPVKPNIVKIPIEYLIDWFVGLGVSYFVTVSQDTQYYLINRPMLAKWKKHLVIYNGIEIPEKFAKNSIREELGIGKNDFVVLMLGTYEERKGHDFLFRSFTKVSQKIPNVYLLIGGDGYPFDRERIRGLIEKYNLSSKVFLLGFRNDILSILQETDVLVAPSQYYESFNLCLVEAMSQKVPIVATKVGGMPEVLSEGGGVMVPLDPDAFAEEVIKLSQDTNLRKKYGEEGRQVYQRRFRPSLMSEKYYQLLNNS